MTWIGTWTVRLVSVFVGIFCLMLALDLLGLNKTSNPFTTWPGVIQCVALSAGVGVLLLIEAVIEHKRWIVGPPFRVVGGEPAQTIDLHDEAPPPMD